MKKREQKSRNENSKAETETKTASRTLNKKESLDGIDMR